MRCIDSAMLSQLPDKGVYNGSNAIFTQPKHQLWGLMTPQIILYQQQGKRI
jgi:hypothetical protein